MQNDFNFCPACGGRHIQNVKMRKWLCADCGFDLYNNVATAVGLIICDDKGRVLFEKRGKEPRKGFLALPGGFVDPDEAAEDAVYRECEEETGLPPTKMNYLCSFPNTYEYKNIVYKTCDLFFEAELPAGEALTAQEGEVTAFEWRQVRNEQDLGELPLAFKSAWQALLTWLAIKEQRSNFAIKKLLGGRI